MNADLIDAHCHLQDARLEGVDLSVLPSLGIHRAVVNGTSESDWPQVADLARRYPDWVRPAFGLHPWYASRRSESWLDTLISFLDEFPDASIGEIGLDRWIEPHDLPDQEAVFCSQLEVATRRNLPLSIHCLKAWGRLQDLLASKARPETGFLLHSYGGSLEMAHSLLPLGARFSFCGYFLLERKAKIAKIFCQLPLERILLETDAPDQSLPPELDSFQLPDPIDPDKRLNHPGNLEMVYSEFARLRGLCPAELVTQMKENYEILFGNSRAND